jgi:hypothetical protein
MEASSHVNDNKVFRKTSSKSRLKSQGHGQGQGQGQGQSQGQQNGSEKTAPPLTRHASDITPSSVNRHGSEKKTSERKSVTRHDSDSKLKRQISKQESRDSGIVTEVTTTTRPKELVRQESSSHHTRTESAKGRKGGSLKAKRGSSVKSRARPGSTSGAGEDYPTGSYAQDAAGVSFKIVLKFVLHV